MPRSIVALTLLVLLFITGLPAWSSADVAPFDAKAFAEAQAAGRSIVVAVNADW
jgi:hypothetical protein